MDRAAHRWLLLVLGLMVSSSTAQQPLDDCPDTWFEFNGHCYAFILQEPRTFQSATIYCQENNAYLVSIESNAEHVFVSTWIENHDQQRRDWFTSGFRNSAGKLIWDSDGREIQTNYFISDEARDLIYTDPLTNLEYNMILYRWFDNLNKYQWAWGRLMKASPFICEISKQDTWKFFQQQRDFSFGTGITDPNQWQRGPNITLQSKNVVFYAIQKDLWTDVVLDCEASGNPAPTYRWFRKSTDDATKQWITSDLGSRYMVTNGRLTIQNPNPAFDVSFYTCEASNEFGLVLSDPIHVTNGFLDEFPNVQTSVVTATMYMGKELVCQPPNHNTALRYSWFKSDVSRFIRPSLNAMYFLSKNGRFYISEVQSADAGDYFCMVFMAPNAGQELAGTQPPTRTSMAIKLEVKGENANTYGPDIQDKFPQYFPLVPMVGSLVELECLAYGRLPLYYTWKREDGRMHPDVRFSDHGRRLIIPEARLEDTGSYTCSVKGPKNNANKTVHLSLKATPSFPYPLRNKHVDLGSRVTWTCNAIGIPKPTYTWFKNGVKLVSNPGDGLTVLRNRIIIEKVEAEKHNGMYQCEATNSYGVARSSGQLRALSFKPTFANTPVDPSKQGAEGGNITIKCRPQAAPRATITWVKNGAEVGKVLPNGDLELSFLTTGDSGTYTCVATNDLGEARSSCNLMVQSGSVFTEIPTNLEVRENETAALPCKASFDQTKSDVIYSWKFNDHVIDFSSNSIDVEHYSMNSQGQSGMLYLTGAQFKHEGWYTCMVSTVTGSMERKAYVEVLGRPGEPGGVHARLSSSEKFISGDIELWWQPGEQHGYPDTKYAIEYQSIYEQDENWKVLKQDIPASDTTIEFFPDWRGYVIKEGLSPGTSYRFRVRAGNNEVGYGPYSAGPHQWYNIATAPPVVAPSNVGGGGGKVGILHISWDPLPRSDWGSNNIYYNVYFRKRDTSDLNGKWQTSEKITKTDFYHLVGRDNYYLPYEVMVEAGNNKGVGPKSPIEIVYSAEAMPNMAPTFSSADAINGTAGTVAWELLPNTREAMKGTAFAYQVNYWNEGDTRCEGRYEDTALFVRFYGQVSSGLLIGMEVGGDYCVNLQFINHAGLGPKTNNYYLGMNDAPPSRYPEFVTVMSHGSESVRLLWRGISTMFGEEPLLGYKAKYWDLQEDFKTAKEAVFPRVSTGVIHGIEPDRVYRVRVQGYSNGGDGQKSPDVYFTLGGQVMYDPATTEVMNSSPRLQHISYLLTFVFMMFTCLSTRWLAM